MKFDLNISRVLSGSFLADKRTMQMLPFLIFLTLLGFIAISSAHSADQKVVKINELRSQMKELEAEHREAQNKLMELGLESEVITRAQNIGLEEAKTPPKKIVVTNE